MRHGTFALACWLGLAGTVFADGPVPQADVDRAIDLGVKGLLATVQADGSWTGPELYPPHLKSSPLRVTSGREGITALALLALLECDVKPDHPQIVKGFARLHAQRVARVESVKPGGLAGLTYDEAVVCMALQAWSEALAKAKAKGKEPSKKRMCHLGPRPRQWLAEVAADIADSRLETGGWGYRLQRAAAPLAEAGDTRQVASGAGARAPMPDRETDHSNTQYAILGLRAAELAGFAVRGTLWQDVLEYALDQQSAGSRPGPAPGPTLSGSDQPPATPRGWSYYPREQLTMTMTCAGLAMVVIAREQLAYHRGYKASDRARVEQAVADGLAWLARRYALKGSTGPGADPARQDPRPKASEEIDGYLLYGLERAAILCDQPRIGAHDWYDEGARLLLSRQAGSGLWDGMHGPSIETAFALLFLKRATRAVPVELTRGPKD